MTNTEQRGTRTRRRPPKTAVPLPNQFLEIAGLPSSSVQGEEYARLIGSWGDASLFIGRQWEEVAYPLVVARLPWSVPVGAGRTAMISHLVHVDAAPEVGPTLNSAGISAPDLLLLGTLGSGGRPVVQAADFKVSLDMANPRQVSAARLSRNFPRLAAEFPHIADILLDQVPVADLRGALASVLAGNLDGVLLADGLFLAPDSAYNRWFLQVLARAKPGTRLPRLPRGAPAASAGAGFQLAAHLDPISPHAFLQPMPGWDEGCIVAALDGVHPEAAELTIAERYWRLGAGARGGLRTLYRPVFAEIAPEWPATPALRRLIRRSRARTSAAALASLATAVGRRGPRWEQERALLQCPLGFPRWLEHAEAAGFEVEDREQLVALRTAHQTLAQAHRQRVMTAARELREGGLSDPKILAALTGCSADWRSATEMDREIALDQVLSSLTASDEEIGSGTMPGGGLP